jgi:hypothetical protein
MLKMEEKSGKSKLMKDKLQNLNMTENQDLYFHLQVIISYLFGLKNSYKKKAIKNRSLSKQSILIN